MADSTIDKLVVQIDSDATSATSGIDALATSLGKLKSATSGGLGLSSVAKNLGTVKDAVNAMGNIGNNMNGLTKAILTLKQLGSIKVSSSIANQIAGIGTALSTLNIGDGASKINELVGALKPLETLGKSSLGTTVNALNKLPEAIQKIDMRTLHGQVDALTRTFRPLAEEMQKIANGFNAFPSRIQKIIQSNEKLSNSNNKTSSSYVNLWAKTRMAYNVIKTGAKYIGSFINKSAEYNETVNRFSVSMGKYADEHHKYAESVGELMGIDPAEWMGNEATFMALSTGFGIVGERASTMSQQLTQLGYDISSFHDISFEDAMLKLQSGLAGELEPLRRIGYDLSVARLQQEAYTLGINKKISAMTQAEKAELRYYTIIKQSTLAQGDMARTLQDPANQLRIFKAQVAQAARAIGSIFIPLLNTVLPYLIAFTKVVRLCAEEIARLFGYEMPEVKDWDGLSSGADDYSSALGDAAKNAKKLQQYTMGFDELNVIDPNKGGDSDGGQSVGGSGFDFELPTYDFLEGAIDNKANEIFESMKDNLIIIGGLVAGVAAGLLTWKFSGSFLNGLSVFSTVLGAAILIDSIRVTAKEGLSWKSAIEGAIGGALMGASIGFMLGGWQGAIGGVLIGIGVSLVINGITGMLADGVQTEDVVAIITGVLGTVAGVMTAIKLFNANHTTPLPELDTAGQTVADVSTGTSKLTRKLKTFAKNMGLGIVILAEAAVAAGIVVGAIWGIGEMLGEMVDAWKEVSDNGDTVTEALLTGGILLAGIGVICSTLGSSGGVTLAVNMGLGLALIAEASIATDLFLAEIIIIGKLLVKMNDAWKPINGKGSQTAKNIGTGTVLLVAIGAAAAGLGVATTATGGALPLAIGLGTALLVELGIASKEFCDSLTDVAKKLSEKLAPALEDLVEMLPDLETNMVDFTKFMGLFAGAVVVFSTTQSIAGIASTVDKIIGFFTTDPVTRMYDEVKGQTDEFRDLRDALLIINPLIEEATKQVGIYQDNMGSFETATGGSGGFLNSIVQGAKGVVNGMIELFEGMANGVVKAVNWMIDGLNKIKVTIPDWVPEIGGKKFGINIKKMSEISIPPLATGGTVDTGQMFIAREAGPEMVGTIGRKTVVANNDQIVDGIAYGVSTANEESNALLREQNSLLMALLQKESGVYLDGKQITNSVERYQRGRGRVLVTGGAY